jgi:hypothetical protein
MLLNICICADYLRKRSKRHRKFGCDSKRKWCWRHLLKIAKLVKFGMATNYTGGAKVLKNYQKKLKFHSKIEYLVKYFATILRFE